MQLSAVMVMMVVVIVDLYPKFAMLIIKVKHMKV